MNAFLFMFTALLWGGGALATAFQAGPVPALVSVGYRMVTAGLLMMLWARWRGVTLTVPTGPGCWFKACCSSASPSSPSTTPCG